MTHQKRPPPVATVGCESRTPRLGGRGSAAWAAVAGGGPYATNCCYGASARLRWPALTTRRPQGMASQRAGARGAEAPATDDAGADANEPLHRDERRSSLWDIRDPPPPSDDLGSAVVVGLTPEPDADNPTTPPRAVAAESACAPRPPDLTPGCTCEGTAERRSLCTSGALRERVAVGVVDAARRPCAWRRLPQPPPSPPECRRVTPPGGLFATVPLTRDLVPVLLCVLCTSFGIEGRAVGCNRYH